MCHVSELSDGYVKNIEQRFNVRQNVRAKVLKVSSRFHTAADNYYYCPSGNG